MFRGVLAAVVLASAGAPSAADWEERIRGLEPGRWLEITENRAGTILDTRLERVFPPSDGHPGWGTLGPKAVMRAWSGGAYDLRRDRLLVMGGGHRDYGGNEVYAFELESFEWRRLTDPSPMSGAAKSPRTTDGTPTSRHTYDGLEMLEEPDRLFLFGGSMFGNGSPWDAAAWLFDPDRRAWQRRAEAPSSGYAAAAVHPETGTVFVRISNRFMEYDPRADRWAVHIQRDGWHGWGTAVIDPKTNRFFQLTKDAVFFLDLDGLKTADRGRWCRHPTEGCWSKAPAHGDSMPEGPPAGFARDPASGRILAWAGGPTVWSFDPESFRWTRLPSDEGPAPERWRKREDRMQSKSRGVYGRWRYLPTRDVFIGVNATDDNVWIYKPPR